MYGSVTCPYCGEEYEIDDLESWNGEDDSEMEFQCECEHVFAYRVHVDVSLGEAYEIPCKNGSKHKWRDNTRYLPDELREQRKSEGRIWLECEDCGIEVYTEEDRDKEDKRALNDK